MRSLCHSRGVTADYLKFQERFKMKKVRSGSGSQQVVMYSCELEDILLSVAG